MIDDDRWKIAADRNKQTWILTMYISDMIEMKYLKQLCWVQSLDMFQF